MEASELMVLLRSVEANGLGLLISWDHLVAQLMVCKSSMEGCFATLTKLTRNDSEMVVRSTFRMEIPGGLTGSVTVIMVP